MDDPIEVALRRKKNSSMRVAVSQVKPADDGRAFADACVSAGNTGALMAVSRYVLKTVEGIDRPAIASVMPNQNDGYTTVLDLGANVDCEPEHLLQFALMGSALVAAVEGKEDPSVGLLNIGEEAIKGSDTIKRAGELFDSCSPGAPQLLRQRGGQRHLQGHDRYRGLRRIRRQCGPQDRRGPGLDVVELHQARIHADLLLETCSHRRSSGPKTLQAPC
jgi:hypothetical protein